MSLRIEALFDRLGYDASILEVEQGMLWARRHRKGSEFEMGLQKPALEMVLEGKIVSLHNESVIHYGAGDLLPHVTLPASQSNGRRVYSTGSITSIIFPFNRTVFTNLKRAIHGDLASPSYVPRYNKERRNELIILAVERQIELASAAAFETSFQDSFTNEIAYYLISGPNAHEIVEQFHGEQTDLKIRDAISQLHNRYNEKINVREMSRSVGMSLSSFYEKFREQTGLTPVQYQKEIRLKSARHQLLVQGLPVSTVASNVGYMSASQFSREYKRRYGVSPAESVWSATKR